MGFLNNVKARFKGGDDRRYEDEFERAFREGSWPEGVEGFEPLANTGAFLPQEYDVDPLADASLPGNALRGAAPAGQPGYAAYDEYDQYGAYAENDGYGVSDSVVRGSGAAAFGPAGERRQDRPARPADDAFGAQATDVQEPVAQDEAFFTRPRDGRPARGAEAPEPDDGVQVFSRGDSRAPRPAPTPQSAPRPFADRLRERVVAAASSVARPALDGFRDRAAAPDERRSAAYAMDAEYEVEPAARRPRRSVSMERDDAPYEDRAPREAEERPERARSGRITWPVERADEPRAQRAPHAGYDEPRPERAPRARVEEERAGEPVSERRASARSAQPAAPAAAKPVPVSCIVLRPRNYDVVSEIAQGAIAEKRPTVLVLRGCNNELIRRVLDFSFGLCCASGAGMRDFGDRVYAILPKNTTLTDEDMVAMRRQGILKG